MNTSDTLFPFKSLRYDGMAPGPRLIVTGAVHGNEVCGTQAIHRLVDDLDHGRLVIARGRLTLVPVTNALAYQRGRREGDRNLNRALGPTAAPRQFEDHVANWLCPLLAENEVLLDLHSFHAPGRAFAMVGPPDNQGEVEPFAHAEKEEALACCLGVDRLVDGWLGTYVRGVARRRAAAGDAARTLDLDPRYGVGTTEYMRSKGGWALTLECGQHTDPQAPQVGYRAIRNALAHLGLTDEPAPTPRRPGEALSIVEVIDKAHDEDRFSREWTSFDRVEPGQLIGTRHDGEAVVAPHEGWILFPNRAATARQEWFYMACANTRF